jgi:hypothetical protein
MSDKEDEWHLLKEMIVMAMQVQDEQLNKYLLNSPDMT